MKINWPKVADFVERVGATFAQAFLALAVVSGLSDLSMLKAAGMAGALAAGKYVLIALNSYLNSAGAQP